MPKFLELLTRAEAEALRAAIDARLGLPQRGRNVGRGKHVDLDATARDGSYIGWTLHECSEPEDPQTGTGAMLPISDRALTLEGETLPGVGRVSFAAAANARPARYVRPDPFAEGRTR